MQSQMKHPLRELVRNVIKTDHPKTVGELAQLVSGDREVADDEFTTALKQLLSEGCIELKGPSRNLESPLDYLFTITISGWFWATMIFTGSAILSVAFIPDTFPLSIIRWMLGSVFVLYLPGYVLIHALFPVRKQMDGTERFALSVGLSLAIDPLVGLILNYFPWGIRLVPIMISLTILAVGLAIIALAREYRVNTRSQT